MSLLLEQGMSLDYAFLDFSHIELEGVFSLLSSLYCRYHELKAECKLEDVTFKHQLSNFLCNMNNTFSHWCSCSSTPFVFPFLWLLNRPQCFWKVDMFTNCCQFCFAGKQRWYWMSMRSLSSRFGACTVSARRHNYAFIICSHGVLCEILSKVCVSLQHPLQPDSEKQAVFHQ